MIPAKIKIQQNKSFNYKFCMKGKQDIRNKCFSKKEAVPLKRYRRELKANFSGWLNLYSSN
jgi:hypothetical protein